MPAQRGHGTITKLPSGRHRARYLHQGNRWSAPSTFLRKADAEGWLAAERRLIESGTWTPPSVRAEAAAAPAAPVLALDAYGRQAIAERNVKQRSRDEYLYLWNRYVSPMLGNVAVSDLTPAMVRAWFAAVAPGKIATRADSYRVLNIVCKQALQDGLIVVNPCQIRNGGKYERQHDIKVLSLDDLAKLLDATPDQYKALILLATWCALRKGELLELRRSDFDFDKGIVKVRRALTISRTGERLIDNPKSRAGIRDVVIPPHIIPAIAEHLSEHTRAGATALLFPSTRNAVENMKDYTLYAVYHRARTAIGRSDLRLHDLRHTGATLAAQAGATLPELMERLGHSSPAVAIQYQHAAQGRAALVAQRMSELITAG